MVEDRALPGAPVLAVLAAVAAWLAGLTAFVLLGVTPAWPAACARVVTPMLAAGVAWLAALTAVVQCDVIPARPDACTRVVTPEPLGDCCADVDLAPAALPGFTAEAAPMEDAEAAGLLGPAMDQGRLRGDAALWKALRVTGDVRDEPFEQRLLLLVLLLVLGSSACGLGGAVTTTGGC